MTPEAPSVWERSPVCRPGDEPSSAAVPSVATWAAERQVLTWNGGDDLPVNEPVHLQISEEDLLLCNRFVMFQCYPKQISP